MSDLLTNVLDAHGGADRWSRVTGLIVRASLGGPFWAARGWPDVYAGQHVTVSTRTLVITFDPFPGPGRRSRFRAAPERLEILDATGAVLEHRDRPRETFPPAGPPSRWDAIQVAYFTSCAMWSYLTMPFSLTLPGVRTEEIDPWTEPDGRTWRRLRVHFPPDLPNHNPDQTYHFDDGFLLRRLDYRPDVTGTRIAHYVDDQRTFDGLVFPTRRSVHPRGADGVADRGRTPITVAVDDVRPVWSDR